MVQQRPTMIMVNCMNIKFGMILIQDGLMKQYYLDGSVKFEANFNLGIKK